MSYLEFQYLGRGDASLSGIPGYPTVLTIRHGERLNITGDGPMLRKILEWMETHPDIVLMSGTQEVIDGWINPYRLPPLTLAEIMAERHRLNNIQTLLDESLQVVDERGKPRKWWKRIKNN